MTDNDTKRKEILSFLQSLGDYESTIPDEVTSYFLTRTGFQSSDPRMKRLIALAAQKFIHEVASDALRYSKVRLQAPQSRNTRRRGTTRSHKLVLTMDDLVPSLGEYGLSVAKPIYFADKLSAGVGAKEKKSKSKNKKRAVDEEEKQGKEESKTENPPSKKEKQTK